MSDGGDIIIEQLDSNNAALDNDSSHEGSLDDSDYSSSKNCPNVWPFCNVWVITHW